MNFRVRDVELLSYVSYSVSWHLNLCSTVVSYCCLRHLNSGDLFMGDEQHRLQILWFWSFWSWIDLLHSTFLWRTHSWFDNSEEQLMLNCQSRTKKVFILQHFTILGAWISHQVLSSQNPSSVFLSTFKFYYGFKHEWTK